MIRIHVFNTHRKYRILPREAKRLARQVLRQEEYSRADITIVFVTDKHITDLNGRYLKHWRSTDVLSFTLSEPRSKIMEGEVYISLDHARRQAQQYGVTIRCEVARLIVHGILHVAGYDDRTKQQKKRMTRLEDRYLLRMNYLRK